nr:uncharacterized protein CFP56_65887 [Quercus suber]
MASTSTIQRPAKRRRHASPSLPGFNFEEQGPSPELSTPPLSDSDYIEDDSIKPQEAKRLKRTLPSAASPDLDGCLARATHVLAVESQALAEIHTLYRTSNSARSSLSAAVSTILHAQRRGGKLITCGVGKSAYIAQKLTATCKSLGVRASFMHACEAAHGDLGDIHDVCFEPPFNQKSTSTLAELHLRPGTEKPRFTLPITSKAPFADEWTKTGRRLPLRLLLRPHARTTQSAPTHPSLHPAAQHVLPLPLHLPIHSFLRPTRLPPSHRHPPPDPDPHARTRFLRRLGAHDQHDRRARRRRHARPHRRRGVARCGRGRRRARGGFYAESPRWRDRDHSPGSGGGGGGRKGRGAPSHRSRSAGEAASARAAESEYLGE